MNPFPKEMQRLQIHQNQNQVHHRLTSYHFNYLSWFKWLGSSHPCDAKDIIMHISLEHPHIHTLKGINHQQLLHKVYPERGRDSLRCCQDHLQSETMIVTAQTCKRSKWRRLEVTGGFEKIRWRKENLDSYLLYSMVGVQNTMFQRIWPRSWQCKRVSLLQKRFPGGPIATSLARCLCLTKNSEEDFRIVLDKVCILEAYDIIKFSPWFPCLHPKSQSQTCKRKEGKMFAQSRAQSRLSWLSDLMTLQTSGLTYQPTMTMLMSVDLEGEIVHTPGCASDRDPLKWWKEVVHSAT